jgi:hypothetical protein
MNLPNAEDAVIDPAKVCDYLLSAAHPVGRFKATFFVSLGYVHEGWEVLRDDILAIARTAQVTSEQASSHGRMFQVDGILLGPSGRSAAIRTAWIVRAGESFPRLVTAFPR